MKWIEVNKELPKIAGEYLVFGLGMVGTLIFLDGYWWSDIFKQKVDQNKISHWMPLPEPPGEKLLSDRSNQIELLEKYSMFLEKNGYMDIDWRTEKPFAIDEFLKENK